MKAIYVELKHGTKVEVATFHGNSFTLQRKGEDGVFSEIKKRPAKNLKDAVKQVQKIYSGNTVTA